VSLFSKQPSNAHLQSTGNGRSLILLLRLLTFQPIFNGFGLSPRNPGRCLFDHCYEPLDFLRLEWMTDVPAIGLARDGPF
jgi:hypothetical protein